MKKLYLLLISLIITTTSYSADEFGKILENGILNLRKLLLERLAKTEELLKKGQSLAKQEDRMLARDPSEEDLAIIRGRRALGKRTEREAEELRKTLQRTDAALAHHAPVAHNCDNEMCGRPSTKHHPLVRCAKCKSSRYCDRDCQIADWAAGHSKVCTKKTKNNLEEKTAE